MPQEKHREGSINKVLEDWYKDGYILRLLASDNPQYGWTVKAWRELKWYDKNITPQEAAARLVARDDFNSGWL